MSIKVIELNDSAVSVTDASGLITQSPGFALVGDRGLEVGRAAEAQARLRPTSSFNKFWHQLSLEPLGYSVGNVRHFADLAFAHLLHIAEEAGLEDDVIFAVPGNFTSQQLAILLGLARQCPFNPVGVVDAALASTMKLAGGRHVVYADIQLHQALLTRFSIIDGELRRDSVIQIPEAGLQDFNNLVMQLATGLFIQQCRFNPQHNAESEQQLYNALPEWMSRFGENRNSLLMEIKTASAVHQAKLPWETLLQKLADFYGRINQQLATITGEPDTQIVISSALAALPDYPRSLPGHEDIRIAPREIVGATCIELAHHINSAGDGFQFVTSLPLVDEPIPAASPSPPAVAETPDNAPLQPTHALVGSEALPLGRITISNGGLDGADGATVAVNGNEIRLAVNGLPAYLGQIEKENNQISLVCGDAGASVNGEEISGTRALAVGDRIRFGETGEPIRLIRVRDGIN